MANRPTSGGAHSVKTRQFYEMFRSQSRVLKAKAAHDELKQESTDQQRLDKLYAVLKDKETKGPTAAPTTAAPTAPTPQAPVTANPAPKPTPPTISVTTEEKVETTLSLPAPNAAASGGVSPRPAGGVSPRTSNDGAKPEAKAEDAAKELAELDRLMQLSLKENDDLSKKILELEIKMKLLENNVPASKIDDLKAGSLKGSDLRPETAAQPAVSPRSSESGSGKGITFNPSQPVATFDEGQKKVVFSQKLRTKEYFEMFKTRSKLIVPAREGRGQLSRGVPVSPHDTPNVATTAPATAAATAPATAAAPSTPAPPTITVSAAPAAVVEPPAVTVTSPPPAEAAKPAAAPSPPAAASQPAATAEPTLADAKAEVAELNDMVENSILENEELQKELANLRVRLEEAEQRASKYKHKSSSSKKKLHKHSNHLISLFSEFLASGGKDRAKLLEDAPQLKDAMEKFDAARK